MDRSPIISRAESLQILGNDLRRVALEKRAADLKDSTPEKRKAVLAEIEQGVRDELRRRAKNSNPGNVIY